ncbi:hypothetical protein [Planotetraspora sp. GP83]|uniref:hypothetical protein n=1 Tax=Planotetraspora sp. GP83 TaxID=3156264 RepID=UPI003518AB8C
MQLSYYLRRAGLSHPRTRGRAGRLLSHVPAPPQVSHGLRRLAAIESVRGSFESAAAAIGRNTGVKLGERQAEALAQAAAADIDDFYSALRPQPRPGRWVLVLSVDGKGIVMRPEALREPTARAAKASSSHLASRPVTRGKSDRRATAATWHPYAEIPYLTYRDSMSSIDP